MFDEIFTKYEDAKNFINEVTAKEIREELEKELKEKKKLSAEKYAYLSKACVFTKDDKSALEYAKKSVKADKNYAYGNVRLAFINARFGKKKETLKYAKIADRMNTTKNILITTFLIMLYDYCDITDRKNELMEDFEKNYDNTAKYAYHLAYTYSHDDSGKAIKYAKDAEKYGIKNTFGNNYILAENYYLLDDYENAEIYADKCLEEGVCINIIKTKSECLKQRDEYKLSAKYLKKAFKLSDEDEKQDVLNLIIYNYISAGEYNKAKRIVDFAMKKFEPTYALYYVAGTCYENIGDYESAIDAYKNMLKIDESEKSIYSSISYCYSQLKNYDEALKYVDKSIDEENPESYAFYRKGRVLCDMKEYEMAVEYFKKSLDYNKTDVDSFQWISYCYSMVRNFEKSLEYANRAILLEKTDAYSYFRKAWALQEMQKYEDAIKYYKKCIEYNDQYVDAYANLSYIYSKTGDLKASILYANKALLINKDYAYAHYRKAWALQEEGKFEEAVDGYSKAIELDPTDIYNYLGIACVSLNTQANQNALLYANKAIFIDRNCGGAYYYKSVALSNLGKTKEAEAAYATAVRLGYSQ